jgi:beta-aspartyl-peptidase (threonine type)
MRHGKRALIDAARDIIHDRLLSAGGSGGLIAVDTAGNIALEFNTEGMYRGYVRPGARSVQIYQD